MRWFLTQDPVSPLETTSWLGSIGSFVLAIPATLLSIWAFRLSWKQQREQERQAREASRAMQMVVAELRAITATMESASLRRDTGPDRSGAVAISAFEDTDPCVTPAPATDDEEPFPAFGGAPAAPPGSGYDQGYSPLPAPSQPVPGGEGADALNSIASRLARMDSRAESNSLRSMSRQRKTNVLAAVSAAVALGAFSAGLLNAIPW
ncbi:hypothetical protein E1202_06430 [Saccharopolyspora karakumensis]|uniref:Uncharacterized protein n=1 Tax=Saccharopolyspora karakumensis TaxID=2530386 RepID=A0A4V2YY05_9PSEU|nr:hypothetical protein [Saccharopolyspora karakumensis]TDD91257.1 hypothetical protein E1202_06430 [Saccharopolyspora karakumensis]